MRVGRVSWREGLVERVEDVLLVERRIKGKVKAVAVEMVREGRRGRDMRERIWPADRVGRAIIESQNKRQEGRKGFGKGCWSRVVTRASTEILQGN